MKVKKIPYYLFLFLLTLGASAIIGFLSFTGMFILAPILGLAIGSFILSVAYEGEIYLQNIKGALSKLFKRDFLKSQLGKVSLLQLFERNLVDTKAEDCPPFLKDYAHWLKLDHKLSHKRLDKKSRALQRYVKKMLKDMENYYDAQLYAEAGQQGLTKNESSLRSLLNRSSQHRFTQAYRETFGGQSRPRSNTEIREWIHTYLLEQFEKNRINTETKDCPRFFRKYEEHLLALNEADEASKKQHQDALKKMQTVFFRVMLAKNFKDLKGSKKELLLWMQRTPSSEAKALLASRSSTYKWVLGFSAVSGFFMSIGITYLLVEAFAILPVLAAIPFATLPAIIIPMALICGAAYTFLIYNAVTDMIHNDTLRSWYYKIRTYLKQGITARAVFIAISAVVLLALTLALTLCTAGTWWTVAQSARPLFSWMSNKIFGFIMGVINPIILGTSQLTFNLQNTSDTLEMIDDASKMKEGFFTKLGKGIAEAYRQMMDRESWLQIINPFRLILKLTVTPLRLLFFLGHLISIGVTADRVPGIPEIASAILGIISEGFEDAHYFVGDLLHNHDHHSHKTKDLLRARFGAGHGHDHSADIPSRLLTLTFTFIIPLYPLAALWDYAATRLVTKPAEPCGLIRVDGEELPSFEQLQESLQDENSVVLCNNKLYYASQGKEELKEIKLTLDNRELYEGLKEKCPDAHRFAQADELKSISALVKTERHSLGKTLSWKEAWDKQMGRPPKQSVQIQPKTNDEWQLDRSVYLIDRFLEKRFDGAVVSKELAEGKAAGLRKLRQELRGMRGASWEAIKERIDLEAKNKIYGDQRFFKTGKRTASEEFLAELPQRIGSAPVA